MKTPEQLEAELIKLKMASISERTPIALSIVISLIGAVGTFFYMFSLTASKDYVASQVAEVRAYVDKDAERSRKDIEYIRGRVDEIFKFLNRMK